MYYVKSKDEIKEFDSYNEAFDYALEKNGYIVSKEYEKI